MQKTIFVVDDSSTNLAMAEEALEKHYLVITLSSANKMFTAMEKITPDLILLDIEMPEMDGFAAIKHLKANPHYEKIPVIFLTSLTEPKVEAEGIELGAVDFILKPFSEPVLLNRIKNHLEIDQLIRERTSQLIERTEQLERLQNSIVFTLADVVENRDSNTGGHIDRTTVYVKVLIEALLERGLFVDEINSWDVDEVISSARLHDLGKVSIPDNVLNKPDKLTDDEFTVIKTHSIAGERLIEHMIERTGEADFLKSAVQFAAYHHEKWNGGGYPYGLKGTDIPLHGRIMAIVDVFDALTTERPYKKAFTSEDAFSIIKKEAGTHFDPDIANVFYEVKDKIEMARVRLSN